MADNDPALYNLRYNQATQGLEGFGGGSPMWTSLILLADGGINQLTGEVTAGPGVGSQVATLGTITHPVTINVPISNSSITLDGTSFNSQISVDKSNNDSLVLSSAGLAGLTMNHSSRTLTLTNFDIIGNRYISTNTQVWAGIGTLDASAALGSVATDRGFLPSKVTTTQRNAIVSPTEGLQIYNTTTHETEFWNGSAWAAIGGSGSAPTIVSTLALTNQGADIGSVGIETTRGDSFAVLHIIDGTHMLVSGLDASAAPGDTLTQGVNVTTITTITQTPTAGTVLAVGSTSGWASSPVLFTPSATGLYLITGYAVGTTIDAGADPLVAYFGYTSDSGVDAAAGSTFQLSTNANASSGPFALAVEFTSGQPVYYNVSAGGTYGAAKYSIYITVTKQF